MSVYRVLARESNLSRIQVAEALSYLGLDRAEFSEDYLESWGDRHHEVSLLSGEAPSDIFTREIDARLREGSADFAVHSAKDLPLPLASDLRLYALLPPLDQGDSLVLAAGADGPGTQTGGATALSILPQGARVGTSSAMRREGLLRLRPDLEIVSIRGRIEERIALADSGELDAVVVATCALIRLGLRERISLSLPFETHALQGHLAVTGLRGRPELEELWAPFDVRRGWGLVSLVGAGPGNPDLITVAALKALKFADVVLYDALANASLIPDETLAVFVGKRKGHAEMDQASINAELARLSRSGKRVVRLKGGDPFVFGRGGEEYRYLSERLIPVEVVPGVSSALAAGAYAGISLSDREAGASVAFCTAYPPERLQAPNTDTTVYFMGSGQLARIAESNIAAGRKPEQPVALVRNASLSDQTTLYTTLGELAEAGHPGAREFPSSPMLVLSGAAVPADGVASWWESRDCVWYTGLDAETWERKFGAEPVRLIHKALVSLRRIASAGEVARSLSAIPAWIVFTSRPAVAFFFEAMAEAGLDSRSLAGVHVACVGEATAAACRERGIAADLVPDDESVRGLLAAFGQHSEVENFDGPALPRVLFPCSDKSSRALEEGLAELGFEVQRLTLYRNEEIETDPGIDLDLIDRIVFSSPSGVRAFFRWYSEVPRHIRLVPIGETTAASLKTFVSDPQRVAAGRVAGDGLPEAPKSSVHGPKPSIEGPGAFRRFHPLRDSSGQRDRLAEVSISAADCVAPLFVVPGKGISRPIGGLRGVLHVSADRVAEESEKLLNIGVDKVLLFGVPDSGDKGPGALAALGENGLVPNAIRALKREFPKLTVITDVCICAYTDHGHCGILDGNHIDNDATLPVLAAMARAHAEAGADWVAPSAMMDGQVLAIREALDFAGLRDVKILGYSAKFASAFYGPFREAAGSAPAFGDRKSYQMDYRSPSQALLEVGADLEEGADAVMVKPAQTYLDVIASVRARYPSVRLAAYHVSGEFASLCDAAAGSHLDLGLAMREVYTAIKRAGADWIIGYGAPFIFGTDSPRTEG